MNIIRGFAINSNFLDRKNLVVLGPSIFGAYFAVRMETFSGYSNRGVLRMSGHSITGWYKPLGKYSYAWRSLHTHAWGIRDEYY